MQSYIIQRRDQKIHGREMEEKRKVSVKNEVFKWSQKDEYKFSKEKGLRGTMKSIALAKSGLFWK